MVFNKNNKDNKRLNKIVRTKGRIEEKAKRTKSFEKKVVVQEEEGKKSEKLEIFS